ARYSDVHESAPYPQSNPRWYFLQRKRVAYFDRSPAGQTAQYNIFQDQKTAGCLQTYRHRGRHEQKSPVCPPDYLRFPNKWCEYLRPAISHFVIYQALEIIQP